MQTPDQSATDPVRVLPTPHPRRLLPWLGAAVGAVLALVLSIGALLALASQARPTVQRVQAFETADIERALQLLRRHDPRRQRTGVVRALALQTADIELLLQHAVTRVPGLATAVELGTDRALLRISLPAPPPLSGRWFNIEVDFVRGRSLPDVRAWRLGRLPLPASAAWPLLRAAAERHLALTDTDALFDVIRGVDFRPSHLVVFYAWREDTADRLRTALVPAQEQQRLRAYNDRLATWAAAQGTAPSGPLSGPVAALFSLARERSSADARLALEESRAALLTLTLYATGMRLSSLLPAAAQWPLPRPIAVTLAGREDLARHYLVSATLATEAGRPVADAIGVYKELADSRGGSGFSFTDLLADRAGTRLGQLALRDPIGLQQRLAGVRSEGDLLPSLHGLPEGLTAEDLQRRYGGVGAPAYERVLADIDARLMRIATLR